MAAKKAAPSAAAAAAAPKQDPLAEAVDELGSIEKELAPYGGKIARAEQLRKAIRAQTPDSQSEVKGARFIALLGPRGDQTIINVAALAKKIGAARFAKFASCTLKALKQHAPETIVEVTRQAATGPRSLKVVERG